MAEQQFTPNELATEEWRHVVGYEGLYSVSNLGRVRKGCVCASLEKASISKVRPKPYIAIELSCKGKKKMFFVHALVMAAFIGPRPAGLFINHIDANPSNNRVSNLEYVTPRQNVQHAMKLGLMPRGERQGFRKYPKCAARGLQSRSYTSPETLRRGEQNPRHKLTATEALWAYSMKDEMSAVAIGKVLGVSSTSICHIWNGRTWRHVTGQSYTLPLLRTGSS